MKKTFAKMIIMMLALTFMSAVPCGAECVISFSDVSAEYWGYATIMEMAEAGIFKGTTESVNGVGTFSPEKVMTRAEFITASLRAIYPEEAKAIENDSAKWWNGYYSFALQKGIVNLGELDGGDLDKPMTREEMAMVMVRCVKNNGEELTQRIENSKIYDYKEIGDYYKDYVQDCFSFGLLWGVDSKGTFLPVKSLTRAEAATVLCRLTHHDARIDVWGVKPSENSGNESSESVNADQNQGNANVNNDYVSVIPRPQKPNTDEPQKPEHEKLPWENGGKQPSEYTWEEYEALSESLKNAFYDSYEGEGAFEEWLGRVQGTQTPPASELPWENGGKQPSEYTLEEFEALSEALQTAFRESFDSEAAFEGWYNRVQGAQNPENNLPWEKGGKQPSEYTWEEFEALSEALQNAFYKSFGSDSAFESWYNRVQGSQEPEIKLPWENGGKQPSEYTWEEYEDLPDSIKNAFHDSFDSEDVFEEWFNEVKESMNGGDLPWENEGRAPSEYTWEEFEAMSNSMKDEFINSFEPGGFAIWLEDNQP